MAMRILNQSLGTARWLRAILLASSALGLAPFLAALPAAAQDATWLASPGSGNFNDAANWGPAGVPTGTAFFGTSTVTALSFSAGTTLDGWTFNAGASAYSFTGGPGVLFTGAGIAINGGSATIVNGSSIYFFNSSTAGSATITNTNAGFMYFSDTSTAGSATIANNWFLQFSNTSTAGSAAITTNNALNFFNSSTAGNATITNNYFLTFDNFSTAGNAAIANGAAGTTDFSSSAGPLGDNKLSAGSISGGGIFYLGQNELTVGGNNLSTNVTGVIADGGGVGGTGASLVKTGTGTMTLSGTNTYTGGTTFAGGTISVAQDANLGGAAGALTFNGGVLQITGTTFNSTARTINWGASGGGFDIANAVNTFELTQDLTGTGGLIKRGAGTLLLSGTNDYSGVTSIEAGTLQLSPSAGMPSMNSRHDIAAGAVLDLNGSLFAAIGSLSGAGTVTTTAGDARLVTAMDSTTSTFAGMIKDGAAGKVEVWVGGFGSTGTAIFTGANTYTGGTIVCDCVTLQLGNGGTTGSIIGDVDNGGTLIFNRSNTYTFAGVISDSLGTGKLIQAGQGNTILTGQSTYTGETIVNAGTLSVNGSIASSSLTTVNSGGTLGGSGFVGDTLINGGVLAPGNSIGTLNVSGSLTMTAASTYLVQISGASSDKTIVTGTATLAGRVAVDPLARLTATTTYTILTAGTISGSFDTTTVLNSFARNARLSYVGNAVLLTLDPGLLSPNLPDSAGRNQKGVATAIDNALMSGGTMPGQFNALFALTGDALRNALTQASGETATGSQQTTFNAMTQFMGMMTDPFSAGRSFDTPGAMGYAATRKPHDAFAMLTKAPPLAPSFETRWSVWASGFGGSQTTDGNAATGSNTARSSIGGTAVGADVLLSPTTIAGFALAGAGTNFSVANGGSGHSDMFQAGAFVRHSVSSAYITAAAAYGWQDVTTDRIVTVTGLDRLHAQFNANAYSARVEGGNRTVSSWLGGVGVTPYIAVQVIAFDLPSYAETVNGGASTFALNYAGKTVTSTRSELGLRTDKSFAVNDAILTLRGRAAWAHDFNSDRSVAATFQSLPGASFTVSGAAAAHDAALTTASAEMSFISGLSLAATFEGEFSDVTRSYAGKGVARYQW
ncbi:autotransporter outer membrane beta-barrel domain-containing protein [Tardiphaga sp. 42S5]|uniref:autotransporter outer membrane beta-barrel domain-containing protein n=1 Tax=Tardiphaga sp. 42S5 TaxID=1404799 RepID=UPI002A5ADB51|nr:autotransporter domain-containing protein [Tardiphaga sp. 42S5]WPO38844.1 autotransporter domain-containing protein [Tardiphaga sp. 42S5]